MKLSLAKIRQGFLCFLLLQSACADQKVTQNVRIINEVTDSQPVTNSITAPPAQSNPSENDHLHNGVLILHKVKQRDIVGNGDGQINRGETIEFIPTFKNEGSAPTNVLHLRLTSFHQQATPMNPLADGVKIEKIPTNEVIEITDNRNVPKIRLDPQVTPGTEIEIIFKLTDKLTGKIYNFPYLITVQA